MADRARSAFMTLKNKRPRTEDDEDDFHLVNERFKREGDLDNIQTGVTGLVAILDSKNERSPRQKINSETQENYGGLMCTTTGARRILKRKYELIAQYLILFLMASMSI